MRSAWVMKLKPGQEAEYKRKHDEIWPEMVELLKSQGVHNYTIYRYGLLLFAYNEKPDDAPSQTAAVNDVVKRWQAAMAPHMETHADLSPVAEPLEEVFRLD
jgi:L-rhamnose mutarotase